MQEQNFWERDSYPYKRDLTPSSCVRTQWEVCPPYPTTLTTQSQTSSHQKYEKDESVVYKLPSPR